MRHFCKKQTSRTFRPTSQTSHKQEEEEFKLCSGNYNQADKYVGCWETSATNSSAAGSCLQHGRNVPGTRPRFSSRSIQAKAQVRWGGEEGNCEALLSLSNVNKLVGHTKSATSFCTHRNLLSVPGGGGLLGIGIPSEHSNNV